MVVTVGSCHATWNLNQATLAAGSTAMDSAAAPATQNTPSRQAAAKGRAPAMVRLRQPKIASVSNRPTVKRYGHSWDVSA